MTEGARTPRKGSRRLRKLGVAAVMVGGSAAGAVASLGGHAYAKISCSAAGDQEANAAFQKLPNGVSFSLCNGSLDGTINPTAVIGKGVPDVPTLPIIKIHADFPPANIPKLPI